MINPSSLSNLLESEFWAVEGIELLPEHLAEAVQLSHRITDSNQQWQMYLNALALLGSVEWLAERAPDLAVNSDRCSLLQPSATDWMGTVCNLQVGAFTVCLITSEVLIDSIIAVPQFLINSPPATTHFYILVEVLEEQELVRIYGYLHRDQLVNLQQSNRLEVDSPTTYALPIQYFRTDSDALLLNLRCLDPARLSSFSPSPPPLYSHVTSCINVATWLRDRLDEVTQALDWVLLPIFTTELAPMRAVPEQFEAVLSALATRHVAPPDTARGAYRELIVDDVTLLFYALVWEVPSIGETTEWLLLVVLAPLNGNLMPNGIRLQIWDESEPLLDRMLTETEQDSYLYAQVVGRQDEQLQVMVFAPNGSILDAPVFAFRPDMLP